MSGRFFLRTILRAVNKRNTRLFELIQEIKLMLTKIGVGDKMKKRDLYDDCLIFPIAAWFFRSTPF